MSKHPTTEQHIAKLHQLAMEGVDLAAEHQRTEKMEEAAEIMRAAACLERMAASMARGLPDFEPTRSVLHRSAAALSLECGAVADARRYAITGLEGNPPEEIAAELRELLESIK